MNCYIIDDNPDAIEMLSILIEQTGYLKLTGYSTDPFHGLSELSNTAGAVDLLFLDLVMPSFPGLELAGKVRNDMIIIIISGEKEYGSEVVELGVAGYLIKPFAESRFNSCVQRAYQMYLEKQRLLLEQPLPFYMVKGSGKGERISVATQEIVYIAGYSAFSKIYLDSGKEITTYHLLKDLEILFPKPHFLRIHRSYIIATSKMTKFDHQDVYLQNGTILPFGKDYKTHFMNMLHVAGFIR